MDLLPGETVKVQMTWNTWLSTGLSKITEDFASLGLGIPGSGTGLELPVEGGTLQLHTGHLCVYMATLYLSTPSFSQNLNLSEQ